MWKIYKKQRTLQIFKETGDSRYIYQNELDKACFQHEMAYGDFKDLSRRTASDKILCDKAFNITQNPKYDGYKGVLLEWFINFLIKETSGGAVKNEITQSKKLAEELQKPIIRKFKKRKVHSSFIDNIWGADLTDIQLLQKFNKQICFLLCIVDIISVNTHGLFL